MRPAIFLPALLVCAGLAHGAAAGPLPVQDVPSPWPARQVENPQAPVLLAQAGNAAYQLQQLEEEVRQLNGRVEELNFQLLQMQEQMRKMQEDNEFRFQQLEGKSGALAGQKSHTARSNQGEQEQSNLGKPQPSEQTTGAQRSDGDSIARVLRNDQGQGNVQGPSPEAGAQPGVKTIDGVEIYQGPSETEGGGGLPKSLGKLVFDDKGNVVETEIDKPIDLTGRANGQQELPQVGGERTGGLPAPGGAMGDVASLQLPDNPDELYDLGYSYFQAGKYQMAEDAFEEFSSRYSDNPKIAEARFWVGESLLSRGLYEDAAKVFLDAHKKYPSSRMGPQTMLKLGVSLAGMNQRELACATFAEIANQYPDSSGAIRAKVAAEQSAASCKAG